MGKLFKTVFIVILFLTSNSIGQTSFEQISKEDISKNKIYKVEIWYEFNSKNKLEETLLFYNNGDLKELRFNYQDTGKYDVKLFTFDTLTQSKCIRIKSNSGQGDPAGDEPSPAFKTFKYNTNGKLEKEISTWHSDKQNNRKQQSYTCIYHYDARNLLILKEGFSDNEKVDIYRFKYFSRE